MARRRIAAALLLPAAILAMAGCGRGDKPKAIGHPELGVPKTERKAAAALGFPTLATKNTTRIAGADPVADAAAVARAVFPSAAATGRPTAVTLADGGDWRLAVAASVLMAPPVRAPLLLSDGAAMPAATQGALDALRPTGSDAAGGAQVIRIGDTPRPKGLKTTDVAGRTPEALAAAIDRLATAAAGKPSAFVMVVSSVDPAYAMPAAAYAAKSGVPVLFTGRNAVPPETAAAIRRHGGARIVIVGPASAVGPKASDALRKLGPVTRIEGKDPVTSAIAFARYSTDGFGWGVTDPGHGFVFANPTQPSSAGAVSALSSSGTYGPLLLVDPQGSLPDPVTQYLLDLQPGYRVDPVRALYNRGWLAGDERAITAVTQARIDALLEVKQISRDASGDSSG